MPYMQKEYSVLCNDGKWLATVVVVPVPKKPGKNQKPEDVEGEVSFQPVGVRIEWLDGRQMHREANDLFILSGETIFAKFPSKKKGGEVMVSETSAYMFRRHPNGVRLDHDFRPLVIKPITKNKGVPLSEHRLSAKVATAVKLAQEAYDAYCEEQRQKRAA